MRLDPALQSAGPLLLRTLDHDLEGDGEEAVGCEGTQRGEVHHDVALAVGAAPTEPPPVPLDELEGRTVPGVVAQRRLHVVVAVQQDRRRPGRAGADADHGVGAVRCAFQTYVEAEVGERARHPVGSGSAVRGVELAYVGHGGDGDELGKVAAGSIHQGGHPVGEVEMRGSRRGGYVSRSCPPHLSRLHPPARWAARRTDPVPRQRSRSCRDPRRCGRHRRRRTAHCPATPATSATRRPSGR